MSITELRALIAIEKKRILNTKPVYENQIENHDYEDIDDFSSSDASFRSIAREFCSQSRSDGSSKKRENPIFFIWGTSQAHVRNPWKHFF